jgi:hypothetical protein
LKKSWSCSCFVFMLKWIMKSANLIFQ